MTTKADLRTALDQSTAKEIREREALARATKTDRLRELRRQHEVGDEQ